MAAKFDDDDYDETTKLYLFPKLALCETRKIIATYKFSLRLKLATQTNGYLFMKGYKSREISNVVRRTWKEADKKK